MDGESEVDGTDGMTTDGRALPDSIVTAWCRRNGGVSKRLAELLLTPADDGLTPGLSVLMCTKDRPRSLERFLGSLRSQTRLPDELVVVDASDGEETEGIAAAFAEASGVDTVYVRVSAPLRGLTKQRNLGARMVRYDLTAFFDDDVVLDPNCLSEMEVIHRQFGPSVVGVAAKLAGANSVSRMWRLRVLLRMVPNLQPGRYHASGFSTPYAITPGMERTLEVDHLPGCAAMWKTDVVRRIGFDERFVGYGLSEDLDFCLRAKAYGNLVVCTRAIATHLHQPGGRPDPFSYGYMEIRNRWLIHQRTFCPTKLGQKGLFWYAWGMDTLLLLRGLLRPHTCVPFILRIAGRVKGAFKVLTSAKE